MVMRNWQILGCLKRFINWFNLKGAEKQNEQLEAEFGVVKIENGGDLKQ